MSLSAKILDQRVPAAPWHCDSGSDYRLLLLTSACSDLTFALQLEKGLEDPSKRLAAAETVHYYCSNPKHDFQEHVPGLLTVSPATLPSALPGAIKMAPVVWIRQSWHDTLFRTLSTQVSFSGSCGVDDGGRQGHPDGLLDGPGSRDQQHPQGVAAQLCPYHARGCAGTQVTACSSSPLLEFFHVTIWQSTLLAASG